MSGNQTEGSSSEGALKVREPPTHLPPRVGDPAIAQTPVAHAGTVCGMLSGSLANLSATTSAPRSLSAVGATTPPMSAQGVGGVALLVARALAEVNVDKLNLGSAGIGHAFRALMLARGATA